jgi:predicted GH43/DUF377 family glycosyl hydrolase
MAWKKQGLIFVPRGESWWARSGAQLPTAEVINNEVIRVYIGCKDADGFGRIGTVDLDAHDPQKLVAVAREPILDLGELGAFDDCGAMPNSIVDVNGRKYLYYQGFQRTYRVPYLTFTGLAIADSDGQSFKKQARTPIMDRTADEPFIRSTPCVLYENGEWQMWYVSTPRWTQAEEGLHYICVIRHATSADGIDWKTHEQICLEPALPDEYAVGRPAVVRDGQFYRMWFSIRSFSELYTIGYAESADGLRWDRKDQWSGIRKSESGWDSEMICYPNVVNVDGRTLMFYNGNGRGVTGFGYAVLES